MKRFRPILWKNLRLISGNFRVLKFELHRHSPELERLAAHKHKYHQCLLYLSGSGRQELAATTGRIHRGTLVVVPSGVRHSYAREGGTPALCLVLAFEAGGSCWRARQPVVVDLPAQELAAVRTSISALSREGLRDRRETNLAQAAEVLQLLHRLLLAAGIEKNTVKKPPSALLRQVRKWLTDPKNDHLKFDQLYLTSGIGRDSLTRRLRRETGLSLTQMRSSERIRRAGIALKKHTRIADAANECGFRDQNYFARWFRRQTGLSPSEWNARNGR